MEVDELSLELFEYDRTKTLQLDNHLRQQRKRQLLQAA